MPRPSDTSSTFVERKTNWELGLNAPPTLYHCSKVAPKKLDLVDVSFSHFVRMGEHSGLDHTGDDPWLVDDDGRRFKKRRALRPQDAYKATRAEGARAEDFVWVNVIPIEALDFVQVCRGGMVLKARRGECELYMYCFTQEHPSWGSFYQHRIAYGAIPNTLARFFAKSPLPCLVEPNTPGLVVLQLTWPNGPDGEPVFSVVDEEDFDE